MKNQKNLKAKQEEQPKQEAKTAEGAANEHMSQFWGYRLTPAEIQAGKSTFIAGWEAAKQQYQREIIEKLNRAGEWRAVEIIKDMDKEPDKLNYCPCCNEKHDFTPDKPTFCKHCSKDHYE